MKQLKKALVRYANDLVLLAGGVTVALGAALIYPPAGLITGGLLAIVGATLNSMGDGGGT